MDEPQPVGEEAVAVVLPPGPGLVPTHNSPPSIPPRSPLRPRPVPALESDDTAMAFASLSGITTSLQADKPLPVPLSEEETSSLDTPTTTTMTMTPTLTKRQHALHELLSSERAYASDLALVREVHIPLALGQPIPHSLPAVSPPNSSGSGSGSVSSSSSSSRTVSTASDPSASAVGATANGLAAGATAGASADLGPSPPMTPDDVKLIFGNIAEIAVFSDLFCQALEEALGDLLEGGKGDDHVGALFLSVIPELERPYKQYITRHPTALNHLQSLPQTSSLQNYLSYTQTIASSLSHAWDLSSLLIKPVQRLLKYPLLLTAIIEETPDSHLDKDNLKEARKQMEEVARNVNEGRRRAEVVRDVLMAKKKPQTPGMTVSASVSLNKVKSLRTAGSSGNGTTAGGKAGKDDKTPEEAILVTHLESELHAIEQFAQQFAKNIVEWARMTSNVILSLRTWSLSFSKVIGLTPTSGSEAFDAYLVVVEKQLMPLCVDLEAVINERVLKELAHLLMTMTQPLKLLASMNEQEPYHYHLMNMTVSQKNRPPPSLLSASTNYLALRGQLAAELPTYISLLHRGLRIFIYRLAAIQTEFWGKVRDQWAALWEMLRLEEELNGGGEETVNVWFGRWSEVNEVLMSLSVVRDPKVVYAELKARAPHVSNAAAGERRERDRSRPERDREYRGDRELADPEADAEYYTLHHLQTFAHHRETTPPPTNIYPIPHPSPSTISYSPSDIGNGYGSYAVPNSPSSYSTASHSGGGGDHRRDSHQSSSSHYHLHHSHHSQRPHSRDRAATRDRDRERERYEREKKKSSAQASNTIAFLGALEPPLSPKFKQKSESPTATVNQRNSGVSGVSGHSGGSGGSSNSAAAAAGGGGGGKARRRSVDLSSNAGGGGASSWMSAVGLGNAFGAGGGIVGGIAASSSGSGAGGGGGVERKKNKAVVMERKTSDESFISKTTVRSPISSPSQQQQQSHYVQYHPYQQQPRSPNSPNTSNRPSSSNNNNASTSTSHNGMARQPTPYPHPHRRRTTGGIEPTPEDLREYGAMLMKEEERRREREFGGYRGVQHHQQQYPQNQQKRPSVGSRSVSAMNPHINNSTNTHNNEQSQRPHVLPHNHNHGGLPRTKSMPLPYYPLTTNSSPSSSRGNAGPSFANEEEHGRKGTGVGEWSTMAVVATDDYRDHDHDPGVADDGENSELFYQPQESYSIGYGQEEGYEYYNNGRNGGGRNARPRERRDATITSSPPVARETGRSGGGGKSHSRSRQRSVGKEDDINGRKRYSGHGAYSSKSDKRPGDVKNDKGGGVVEKEKDKASRKRSGSIKSITTFFTSNRDSHHSDTISGSGVGTPSLSHSSSTFTTSSTASTTTTDHTPSPRDSWALKPAKYACIVTHPCKPPSTGSGTNNTPLSYFSFPFFTLKEGELYDVLQEAGHPSLHPNLPLIVDEGEDCLLLCRRSTRGGGGGGNGVGEGAEGESSVGWALASFLEPCNSSVEEL